MHRRRNRRNRLPSCAGVPRIGAPASEARSADRSPPVLHLLPPGQYRAVAHRGDVGLMFRFTAVTIVVLATLLGPRTVEAQDCKVLLIPCMYEGVPFALTVVDAETDQPLAEVHGLAEGQNYAYHGRKGPPMVQDAVTAATAVLGLP